MVVALVAAGVSLAAERIASSRVWPAQEYTRVTLESARPIRYQSFFVTQPERLVVDLEGVELDDELKGLPAKVGANDPYIQSVRVGVNRPNVVRVVFDPAKVSFADLLRVFWESHDPTQGMRQGNDTGTQYRSAIYTYDDEQRALAEASRKAYQCQLKAAGHGAITTEIAPAGEFYFAEDYHQQYLAKNPGGYCGLGGTGVACPTGIADTGTSESV